MMTESEADATLRPFRVVSRDPRDAEMLARMAPGYRTSLRYAAGLCVDLQQLARGSLYVVDRHGEEVERELWYPGLMAARRAQ